MRERDPDLPILDELGAEFEALVEAAHAAEADRHTIRRRAPAGPSRQARERRAQVRRIGRRAAIVLVLICLVGGVAVAALRGGGGSGGQARTAPTPLGRAGDGAWSFSAYRDGGRLCTVFVPRGGELGGSCGAAPGRGRVRAESAIADGHRYVFGVAGPGVKQASVAIGEGHYSPAGRIDEVEAGLNAPEDRDAASAAGFPAGDGWFVIRLGGIRGAARRSPAFVTPMNARGHRAGPSYVDCSLGIIGPACRRRIEVAAAGR